MVAELLRLRFRILANGLRRHPAHDVVIVVALLAAIAGVVAFWLGARWVSQFDDEFIMRATTTLGAWLSLAALLLPIMIVRRPVLSPRAFLGYPISPVGVVAALVLFSVVGPGILLVPMALASVAAWPGEASQQLAWAAAPLLFLQTLVTIQLARGLGMLLRRHPIVSVWVEIVSAALLLLGGASVVGVLAPRIPGGLDLVLALRPFNAVLRAIPEVLAQTPFGMLWAAPGYASVRIDDPTRGWNIVGLSALLVTVLVVAWIAMLGAQLRPTRRLAGPRRTRVPGWFARVPATPAGAIAARALSYWARDPRYRAVYAVLPLVLGVTLLALAIGGVPFSTAVLVPLPVMTFLLAWSTMHNDVAYDHTAVWQHLAAQTRGAHDRTGRSVPVLLLGAALLAVGIPLTVWGHGALDIAPALTGVCAALLLGGVGVGNLFSARHPYAAPHPGDPAWQAPQAATSQGAMTQGASALCVLLVTAPALVLAGVWWVSGGVWGWAALAAGALCGIVMHAVGIRAGGRSFDARGPELLAFTLRN